MKHAMFGLCALLGFSGFTACASSPDTGAAVKLETEATAKVVRVDTTVQPVGLGTRPPNSGVVIDVLKGDELVLDNGWVVRLAGIDVPTADYGKRQGNFYGREALEFSKSRVLNKTIQIEYDRAAVDAYDRALGYVRLADGTFLNEALVAQGFALAACFPPNTRYCSLFSERQRTAVEYRKGLWSFDPADWPTSSKSDNRVEGVLVRQVIDGDTVQLEDGTIVRYIGIDAPESETSWRRDSFGFDAYSVNRELVEGKQVSLEYDVELTDPRGRELAYVYVNTDAGEIMVNAELVRRGVAWVAVFPPNVRHVGTLYRAQEAAMQAGAGLWKKR